MFLITFKTLVRIEELTPNPRRRQIPNHPPQPHSPAPTQSPPHADHAHPLAARPASNGTVTSHLSADRAKTAGTRNQESERAPIPVRDEKARVFARIRHVLPVRVGRPMINTFLFSFHRISSGSLLVKLGIASYPLSIEMSILSRLNAVAA